MKVSGNMLRVCLTIGIGQLLSLNLAGTGVGSQSLSGMGLLFPTLVNSSLYLCLLLFLIPRFLFQRRKRLYGKWWHYLVCAILDVEANVLVVNAYRYTTIASVMFLDCFSTPASMLLSMIVLGHRYSLSHIIAVGIAVLGMVVLIMFDAGNASSSSVTVFERVVGDLCCITGATLYAVANVFQEALIKAHSTTEYLGMMALFAAPLALVQATFVGEAWAAVHATWTIPGALAWLLFLLCMVIQYSGVPLLLLLSSAAFMNMSFLSSDIWGLVLSVVIFHNSFSLWYLLSAALVFVSLGVFSWRSPKTRARPAKTSGAASPVNDDEASLLGSEVA
ncbi:solute carrier family 35 [Carpediemonas membranifera]|uniref:Solute carrier family 35 n=1 Tax=Carpediemonas membranifera TaxID=201153 RepID=A0A8J6ASG1_9EUKA|nr:solute carrier family 35 [Carpediemonas membranifera]|eukprot:KAG9392893.1 solute carrier family 35 [Carpediemonas membranifera]